jgi:hypothetical protein
MRQPSISRPDSGCTGVEAGNRESSDAAITRAKCLKIDHKAAICRRKMTAILSS